MDTKFISYLPHSGMHNQRLELENALVLAKLTNRTVLVPPIRLGTALPYVSSDRLGHILHLSGKQGLEHCARLRSKFLPPECLDQDSFTYVSPAWLFNFTNWDNSLPPLAFLDELSSKAALERLHLSPADVLSLGNASPYQYRFLDTNRDLATLRHKYDDVVYIPDLLNVSHRLIELGSLFGSSRLRLRLQENKWLRTRVRSRMTFVNPVLVETVDEIEMSLNSDYLGAHIRLGDGAFRAQRTETLRRIHEQLVLEATNMAIPAPLPLQCRGRRHTSPEHHSLNRPLFVATDVSNAATDPSFGPLLETFPCTFFLRDFDVERVGELRNAYDGLTMGAFLQPILEALVVGRAQVVVGTEGSTFSQYIEDVLARLHRGLDIAERG